MANHPLVTIYITTKNRCHLLKRAIDSALNQTWSNTEIIVCDDGSTDNTEELLKEYKVKYSNFNYLRNNESSGACVSRNRAMKEAKGEYITGLDDDDYFLPNRVATLVDAYNDNYAFVCSSYYRKTNEKIRLVKDGIGKLKLSDLLHYNKVGNQVLTKTSRFRDVGGFDETLPAFQDYDMWVRLQNKFGSSLKIKEPSYIFDISHDNDRISGSSQKVIQGYKIFLAKHQNLMSKKHIKSMQLLNLVIHKTPLNIFDVFRLCNSGNYKSVLSNLLKRN